MITITDLVPCDGVKEWRDALVKEAEDVGEVHDNNSAANCLDVVLLQDVQHLARDGNGGVARGHQILRAFSKNGGE